jgi:phosphoglycolate phosphatase-like HAD superfamily hydrolase
MRDVIAQLYETVDLKPGVRTLLAKLQAEGARLCLCSNTWADQCRTVLTRLGIADYFSFIVEAQGVLHKSRPEVFFECMHRLGRRQPGCSGNRSSSATGPRRFHCPQGRVHRAGRAGRRQCRRCPCHGAGV